MKRIAILMLGLALVASTSGCYCWPWYNAGGYGNYGTPYGSPCGPGGCGVTQPGTVIPNGTFAPQGYYVNPGTAQAGIPVAAPIAVAPQPAYPTMAFGPMETLPTY